MPHNVPDTTSEQSPDKSIREVHPSCKLCSFTHQRLKLFTPRVLRRCSYLHAAVALACRASSCRFSTFPFPGSRNHGRRRHFHVQRFGAETRRAIFLRTDASDLSFYQRLASKPRMRNSASAWSHPALLFVRAIRCNQNRNVSTKVISSCLKQRKLSSESLSILITPASPLCFSIITSSVCNIARLL